MNAIEGHYVLHIHQETQEFKLPENVKEVHRHHSGWMLVKSDWNFGKMRELFDGKAIVGIAGPGMREFVNEPS